MDWIALAQDRSKLWAIMNLVNLVMNLWTLTVVRVHKMRGFSLLAEDLFGSQEQHCCIQLIRLSY